MPATSSPAADARAEANKRLVLDFYRHVFDAQNPSAVKDFVTEDYKQHARHMPGGRDGLEDLVRQMFPGGPLPVPDEPLIPPAILMAEEDVVVIAAGMPQPDPADPSRQYTAYVYDAYRIRDGKIAEHWSGVDKAAMPEH